MLQLPKMDLILTENRGWGVKAAAPIPKGTFIVEYAGGCRDPWSHMLARDRQHACKLHRAGFCKDDAERAPADPVATEHTWRKAKMCELRTCHEASLSEDHGGFVSLKER